MAKAKKKATTVKKETAYVPKRYEVNVYKKLEPTARDTIAGRFGYWESTNELKLLEYKDSFGADMEGLLLGDIMVEGMGISVNNDPKNWIKNLCNTNWRKLKTMKYYATATRELNETE